MLVNGQWRSKWDPVQSQDEEGRFIRQGSQFRNWITPDGRPGPTGEGGFAAEPGRYHLYVALICPWASRTLMVRKLKGLKDLISVTVVEPFLTDEGWRFGAFPGSDTDRLNGTNYLHEIYTRVQPDYSGRATVPLLWDKQRRVIVNNESADIVRMLNTAFSELTGSALDLYPSDLRGEIDALNERLYSNLNNGVYQAGFARSQRAYEEAYENVFAMLDELEERLSDGRQFLFGDRLTESDIRLFVTLVRFDLAYYGLFKCNRNLIAQMPYLSEYVARVRSLQGIEDTVNAEHIKTGYYSVKALNPQGIVPVGPDVHWQGQNR
jgi:putative glutathione S-transferase